MSHTPISSTRKPLVIGDKSYGDVTQDVLRPIEARPTKGWFVCLMVAATCLVFGAATVWYQIATGIGTWGLNKTVGWAWDITNFVFWVGIGHAGTLISAILLLFRQKWRTSINRAAEAMTIFAVICAAIFPVIHMGRPWLAFWVFPYPNTRGPLWVNFRSPLLWDVFAISTYFTISLVFWFIGLIPDLATMRDHSSSAFKRKLCGVFSLGWNGSARTWARYETLCLILAGLATPLVVSVHSIVSMDFATAVIPGWHATLFPPYFVAGAVFSGFAMVLTLMILTRKVMKLDSYITDGHLQMMCKVLQLTGLMVALAYSTEFFMAWYSGNAYERFVFINRATGPFAWAFWTMVTCNVVLPQLLWIKRLRLNVLFLLGMSIVVNIGMWFERFVIITTSIHRDYLPSSWADYAPTWVEKATFLGTFGLFFTCFLLFLRFLPMIAISEVKGVLHYGKAHGKEVTHG
ncbi:MAG: polysulfide reductase NrfD [Bdellovibrionaceae bacterium]|nr:polysulfide reductase NrfD [Bdellovibrionales bacterium]MCB9254174.1 polysulfide reductase NrfD [Pseudobdellovibrionaceae bacterium]